MSEYRRHDLNISLLKLNNPTIGESYNEGLPLGDQGKTQPKINIGGMNGFTEQ
jgi:hypothetical protein